MATTFEGQRANEGVIFIFRRHILTSIKGFFFLIFMAVVGFLPKIMWSDDGYGEDDFDGGSDGLWTRKPSRRSFAPEGRNKGDYDPFPPDLPVYD